ncbi:hypothetical protein [Mariniblastus fucicola]|uniref:Glycosyltransferase RgtA/B/C/D-like domain-containing protein n=1 Tax=Mariniblastus fucicola TaxID=980251 RepID=A0A5B9PKP1_9BACT|nr:hypothetical protein [Mariniblastus fucicola]QEG22963.1 hypothetical protein MFFC18_28540 [Mariniblastus fucicola]
MHQKLSIESTPRTGDISATRSWCVAAVGIIALAIVVRLLLNFRHAMAPGMDAAYYPMQTQWLIENGELQLSATPLTFWLHAILTKVIIAVSSLSLNSAAALSARLFDCFIPPLIAIPIMRLGFHWSEGRRSALLVCVAAAALVVLSPPIMRMAGDLQKNTLGMLWMGFAIWAMRNSLAAPKVWWRWLMPCFIFVLAGLTHIGAFGATVAVLAGCLFCYAVLDKELWQTRKIAASVAMLLLGVAISTFLIAWLTPSQFRRMGSLLSQIFGFSPTGLAMSAIIYPVLFWLMRKLMSSKTSLPKGDKAIALGTAFGVGLLIAPIFDGAFAMRFQLMAIVPAAFLLALSATALEWDRHQTWHQKGIVVVAGLLALASLFSTQGPVITQEAATELKQIATTLSDPSNTIVVAPHGMEFWAGHLMSCRVKHTSAPDDLSIYRRVLFLQPTEKTKSHGRRRRPPPNRDRWTPHRPDEHGPSQQRMTIPKDTAKVWSGEYFTLYELNHSAHE